MLYCCKNIMVKFMVFKNLSIIFCSDKDNLIGIETIYKNNDMPVSCMPWGCSNITDLNYFKKLTQGTTVIMGYNTFKSIGKPLFNRKNIVLSKSHYEELRENYPEVIALKTLDNIYDYILTKATFGEKFFIIGGNQLFKEFWESAQYIYHTIIGDYVQTFNDDEISKRIYIQNINQSKYKLIEELYVEQDQHEYIRKVYQNKIFC